MRFDAYGASVPSQPSFVEAVIAQRFDGKWTDAKPRNGFKKCLLHSETGARLQWGGHNPLPHLHCQGERSQEIADHLRSYWPGSHRVSRMDVCLDFDSATAWERCKAVLLRVCDERGVDCSLIRGVGKKAGSNGQTYYGGAKSSDMRVRLYQKGLKEISEGREVSPNWVRLEAQYRPQKEFKSKASVYTPQDVWGAAKWSSELISEVTDVLVPFVRSRGFAVALKRQH